MDEPWCDLFDDDVEAPSSRERTATRRVRGGADVDVVKRIVDALGVRVMPTSREKVPVEPGWTKDDYWNAATHGPLIARIDRWVAAYGQPNFALVLGPACGSAGDLVVEADNEAGENWLRKNLPTTPIMTATRNGRAHRHFVPDQVDAVRWRGNHVDVLSSKRAWEREARVAGYVLAVRTKDAGEAAAQAADERRRAEREIPMGPLIDIKCVGGQAMCPGSRHATGFVYSEVERWTPDLWAMRPTFCKRWFPARTWATAETPSPPPRPRADDFGSYWTQRRRYAAALNYVRRVPAKSTGENSSATFMRLATALVRGFWLEPVLARELATYWATQVCAHEPWSAKEIEHKLRDAQERGRLAWGEFLRRDRMRRR